MSQENLDALKRLYERWAAGDWSDNSIFDPYSVGAFPTPPRRLITGCTRLPTTSGVSWRAGTTCAWKASTTARLATASWCGCTASRWAVAVASRLTTTPFMSGPSEDEEQSAWRPSTENPRRSKPWGYGTDESQ